MTTNHPEMLDPAFIHPGRIDKNSFLSYLGSREMAMMMEHFSQVKLNENKMECIQRAVAEPPILKYTPAEVEQLACEFEEVDDMVDAIEEKKKMQQVSKNVNNIVHHV